MLDNALIKLIIQALKAGETAAGIPGTPIAQAFQPTRQGVNSVPTIYLHKIGDHRYGWRSATDVWNPINNAVFTASISGSVLNVTAVASGSIIVGSALIGDGIPNGTVIISRGTGTGSTGTYNINRLLSVTSESMTSAPGSMTHTESQKYETTFQLSALGTQNPSTPDQYTASDICNLCASILQSQSTITTFQNAGVGIEKISEIRNPYFMDDREQPEASPSFDFVVTHNQIIVTTTPITSEIVLQVEEV